MKATLDIPDELYRRVKAKSALEGRKIREVTIELYSHWVEEAPGGTTRTAEEWLAGWLKLADETLEGAADGPTARELLSDARGRLERG